MCADISTCVYTYTYVDRNVHVHGCTAFVCSMYAFACTKYSIHTYCTMHMRIHTDTLGYHTYVRTCIHAYIHTYIHTHIHTYTRYGHVPIHTESPRLHIFKRTTHTPFSIHAYIRKTILNDNLTAHNIDMYVANLHTHQQTHTYIHAHTASTPAGKRAGFTRRSHRTFRGRQYSVPVHMSAILNFSDDENHPTRALHAGDHDADL